MLSTDQIMQQALDMAGMTEIPGDCGIYIPSDRVQKVLFGVDIGPAELMLAKQLGCDLALAHHPISATQAYPSVLSKHIRWMTEAGVPEDVAEQAVQDLIERLTLMYHTRNWGHDTSVAELLDMPFMNIHSPLDEIGRNRMIHAISKLDENATVGDVVDTLNMMPEYAAAPTDVQLVHGNPSNAAGKVVVVHGAGTNGGFPVAKAYFDHGVSTVIYIHIHHPDLKQLREYGKGNLIICGHIAGDLLGMNPFSDWLESQGVQVVKFSGMQLMK